jgi:predicted DNA-binding antitoxin AbrB/MazE fold protein
MVVNIRAIYENGVLRPEQPLPLAEGEWVDIRLTRSDPAGMKLTEPIEQQLRAAKTLAEMFAVVDALPESEDDYDLLRALDENRKGERPLFPEDLRGKSW